MSGEAAWVSSCYLWNNILSFMDYRYLFHCSSGQCIWNCCFSL